jgi:C-terminal processing protease CtpA/Prc
LNGTLKTGDRILAVNDIDLTQASHDRAVEVIRNSQTPVKFLIQSLLCAATATATTNNTVSQMNESSSNAMQSSPKSESKFSIQEMDENLHLKQQIIQDESHDEDLNENIYNYTLASMREKYNYLLEHTTGDAKFPNCKIYVFKLRRERADESLGLSLSGNVNLNKTSVFVCGIYANSIAHRHGLLRVGDQILEINGHCLYGRAHSNVTPLIRNIKDLDVFLVILRNEENLNQMFMPSFQVASSSKSTSGSQSPSSVNNETILVDQEQLSGGGEKPVSPTLSSNENHVRKMVIKKGPTGFGIAISEDKYRRLIVRGLNPNGVAFQVSFAYKFLIPY